jgi:DNA-binding transcriptional LysR family regulator
MQDLNDLFFFARVVDHGGFAPAGRALGVPKSKLSRRIAQLEDRLGVRLIQRSTRRFSVTEAGQAYYRHCLAMVVEAEAAQEAIDRARSEPQGLVRISCPATLAQTHVAPIVGRFLAEHPRVRIHLEATNRRVDVIEEGFDIAIRVRMAPLEDTDLVIRKLQQHTPAMVASPSYLARRGRPGSPGDLQSHDSLDMSRPGGAHAWRFVCPEGREHTIPHHPRLVTDDMATLRRAALNGVGIVQLPRSVVEADIAGGALEQVLPEWTLPSGILHLAFPSRRGLVPAVRAFIDALVGDLAGTAPR